jgi:lipoyl(octanoyl) transferase
MDKACTLRDYRLCLSEANVGHMDPEWKSIVHRAIAFEELEMLQRRCIGEVLENPSKRFLLVSEPLPTFTKGRSADPHDLLWNETEQKRHRIAIHPVSRGGKWTFHGPGQVVLYVVARLENLGLGSRAAHQFLATLRGAALEFLSSLSINVEPGDKPFGIFHEKKKLVSFGVCISRGIVSHGMALYCRDQSLYFGGIHPCGVPGGHIISLEELGIEREWEDIAASLSHQVKKSFKSHEN